MIAAATSRSASQLEIRQPLPVRANEQISFQCSMLRQGNLKLWLDILLRLSYECLLIFARLARDERA
jgi:hypothetical protein